MTLSWVSFRNFSKSSPSGNTIVSGRDPENGHMIDLQDAEFIAQSITFMSDIESIAFKQKFIAKSLSKGV